VQISKHLSLRSAQLLASPFAPFCCPAFYLTKGEIKGSKANKHQQEIEGKIEV
jgi:hypothetical protein